jgi:hypothetical protein
MTGPNAASVREALDELVKQFADPFAFLRELVQNAIDAGSAEIDVVVEYTAGDDDAGVTTIRVDDYGCGMTREIIEAKLTRLFSSSKDGDQTKIGKFGIGFVSVFAIDPDAVCVDTSREGESWRLLFGRDRNFELRKLATPTDGTKVRVIKAATRAEHEGYLERARETLARWCRHATVDIRFCGSKINLPFELPDTPCQVAHDDGFSRIVVGHRPDGRATLGFYNSGLTLLEGEQSDDEEFSFKAMSPHLEHTLTRDKVIEDDGFARVMETVAKVVDEQLSVRVAQRLESDGSEYLVRALTWHVGRRARLPQGAEAATPFRSPSGTPVSIERARLGHRDDEVLTSPERTPLTDALEQRGSTVLLVPNEGPWRGLVRAVVDRSVAVAAVGERYCTSVRTAAELERPLAALAEALRELLRGTTGFRKLADVVVGSLAYAGSTVADRVAIAQSEPGEVTSLDDARVIPDGVFSRARTLVLNADHPGVRALARVAASERGFAAYVLAKQFFLGHRLDATLHAALAAAALEMRSP